MSLLGFMAAGVAENLGNEMIEIGRERVKQKYADKVRKEEQDFKVSEREKAQEFQLARDSQNQLFQVAMNTQQDAQANEREKIAQANRMSVVEYQDSLASDRDKENYERRVSEAIIKHNQTLAEQNMKPVDKNDLVQGVNPDTKETGFFYVRDGKTVWLEDAKPIPTTKSSDRDYNKEYRIEGLKDELTRMEENGTAYEDVTVNGKRQRVETAEYKRIKAALQKEQGIAAPAIDNPIVKSLGDGSVTLPGQQPAQSGSQTTTPPPAKTKSLLGSYNEGVEAAAESQAKAQSQVIIDQQLMSAERMVDDLASVEFMDGNTMTKVMTTDQSRKKYLAEQLDEIARTGTPEQREKATELFNRLMYPQ